jgi:plastocyanin
MTASLVLMAAVMGYDDCCGGVYYGPSTYGYTYSAPAPVYSYGYRRSWSPFRRFRSWGYSPYYYSYAPGTYYYSTGPVYSGGTWYSTTPQPSYAGSPMGESRRVARPDLDAPTRTVRMTSQGRFEPAQITIRAGETVQWRNDSSHPHTVTADPGRAANPAHVVLPDGAEPFDSGEIAPGATFTHTFDVPGTYIYVCSPHEEDGMMGIVVVRNGTSQPAEGAPRPQPPESSGELYDRQASPTPQDEQGDRAADERLPPPPSTSSEDY